MDIFYTVAVCTMHFIYFSIYHTNTASEDIIAMGMILSGVLGSSICMGGLVFIFLDITELWSKVLFF